MRLVVAVVLILWWSAAALVVAPPASAQPVPPVEVNVYVVKTSQQNGGRPETLSSIAARTLDDTGRAAELLDLNRGRRQPDGGSLNGANDALRPGWLLRLPEDARGADVQRGLLSGASAPAAGSGPIRVPVLLVVVLALVILQLTLAIVFRRALGRGWRAGRDRVRAGWNRLLAPIRRRRDLGRHREIAAAWHGDRGSLVVASTVFAELAGEDRRPIAVELGRGSVLVRTATGADFPAPWRELEPNTWQRPPPPANGAGGPPVARVGGTPSTQVLVDLSRCDGAIAVGGDPAVGRELVTTLVGDLASRPDLEVAVLGTLPTSGGATRRLAGTNELEALVPAPSGPSRGGPLSAGARSRRLRGVVVVGDDVDASSAATVADLCARPGSAWVSIVVANPVAAHWHWTVHGNGIVEIAMIERDLVAAL